ncbi:hypothetical protein [Streptomyces fructofermentans]|uniref:Uncharacterized protein n=1 Tax=Streptomyces fructofermentans TaxID=152141 RepID=A0A918KVZ6_9ACTN|nr:hypothetical protein [Streptomyces fructofermentans]GGX76092.1 hypothetical protein GCM10010515_49630 [Streptomyces fructofermentans]
MPREDSEQQRDPAEAAVSLATEAALLEARLAMLREAIDAVDARMEAVSQTLRRLRAPASERGRVDPAAPRDASGSRPEDSTRGRR